MAYLQCWGLYNDETQFQDPSSIFSIFLYVATVQFVFANLCLTIERSIAVWYVSHYEKYSQQRSAIITYGLTTVPAIVIGTFVCIVQTNVVPVNALLLTCSLSSAIISIVLRIYRRTPRVMDIRTSLRMRYQIEENSRTMPLYLWISMNEILTAIAISCVFYFYKGINRKFALDENDSLANSIDVINAYRILFTHAAVIKYWIYLRSEKGRLQSTIRMTQSQTTDDHFNSIKQLWK